MWFNLFPRQERKVARKAYILQSPKDSGLDPSLCRICRVLIAIAVLHLLEDKRPQLQQNNIIGYLGQ